MKVLKIEAINCSLRSFVLVIIDKNPILISPAHKTYYYELHDSVALFIGTTGTLRQITKDLAAVGWFE